MTRRRAGCKNESNKKRGTPPLPKLWQDKEGGAYKVLEPLSLYPASRSFVNTAAPLELAQLPPAVSTGAASFFRWVSNWHLQTGDVWAGTPYLARRSGRSETTLYRWLRELERGGYISRDVVVGVERRIIPLLPADVPQLARDAKRGDARINARQISCKQKPPKISYKRTTGVKKMTGVMAGVMAGVPPYSQRFEEKTTTAKAPANTASKTGNDTPDCLKGAAVAALISTGLGAAPARQLVGEVGPETVLEQVKALPYRKAANPVAVVVASIKNRWSIPDAVKNAQIALKQAEKRQADKVAKQRAETVVRAVEAAKTAELETRLAGLSAFERAELEKQAAGLWQAEKPGSFAVMAGRAVGAVVLRDYMARVLQSTAAKESA